MECPCSGGGDLGVLPACPGGVASSRRRRRGAAARGNMFAATMRRLRRDDSGSDSGEASSSHEFVDILQVQQLLLGAASSSSPQEHGSARAAATAASSASTLAPSVEDLLALWLAPPGGASLPSGTPRTGTGSRCGSESLVILPRTVLTQSRDGVKTHFPNTSANASLL